MITTNREDYKKDLEEVINVFTTVNNVEVTHRQKTDGRNFLDEFTMNGKVYSYKNTHDYNGELELKRLEKRFSKLGLYNILTKVFNITPPWGSLTGIRPVKLAYTLKENFESEFKEVFSVSNEKISLVKKILSVQKNLVDINNESCDFFIGIPFCPSRCAYCSFMSEEIGKSKNASAYVDALVTEISETLKFTGKVRSVYIGGGTPVSLSVTDLEKILVAVSPIIKNAIEFTVEAGRPDCITEEKLLLLKKYGVTRLCVNPQTFHDKTLKIIGRNHTVNDIFEKFELVKKYGFIINTDLIAGLNGETFEDFKYSVDTAIKLDAENITIHTLCLKKGSKLKESTNRLSEGEVYNMVEYAHQALQNAGYNPYYLYRQKYTAGNLENTGYSKPNYECVYNANVMEEFSDNIACGANAVSKRVFNENNRIERYGSPKDILTYINKLPEIIKSKQELYKR